MRSAYQFIRVMSLLAGASALAVLAAACADGTTGDDDEAISSGDEPQFTPQAVTSFKLTVPFQSQKATGCLNDNWCCGLASGNMATAYLHGVAPTAAYLQQDYQYLGLNSCCISPSGVKGTNIYDVANVAKNVGNAPGSTATCLTFAGIKTTLQAFRPVAVAISYGKIAAARRCATFTGNHMVLVTGYDEVQGVWIVNDPLCSSGAKVWPSQEFRDAAKALAGGCTEAQGDFFGL